MTADAPTPVTSAAFAARHASRSSAAAPPATDLYAIRVALVSDQRVLLESLAVHLDMQPGLAVVLAANDGHEAAAKILSTQAEVVVLDADLACQQSFEIVADLRERGGSTKLLFLSGSVSDPAIVQALQLNAGGFLLKSESIEMLVRAIELAAAGKVSFSGEVLRRLTYDERRGRYAIRDQSAISQLTNRQLQILRYLAHGDSVKEVAHKLGLSPKSIDSHKYRIMQKVGVRDRVHLARYAIRMGLVHA